MLAKYSWLSGVAVSSVLSDIASLICGVGDINALSAACDKVNSQIYANTLSNNWQSHDASAGTNSVCVKSLNGNNTYKYVQLTLTSSKIQMKAWEGWNATTHVGTNAAGSSSTSAPLGKTTLASSGNTASAGSITIYATTHNLYVDGCITAEFAGVTSALGDSYPRHVIYNMAATSNMNGIASPNQVGISRIKAATASGDLLVGTNFSGMIAPYPGQATDQPLTVLRTPSEASFFVALPLYLSVSLDSGSTTALIGKLYDLVYIPNNITTNLLDEVTIDGVTYFKIASYNVTAAYIHHIFAVKG